MKKEVVLVIPGVVSHFQIGTSEKRKSIIEPAQSCKNARDVKIECGIVRTEIGQGQVPELKTDILDAKNRIALVIVLFLVLGALDVRTPVPLQDGLYMVDYI